MQKNIKEIRNMKRTARYIRVGVKVDGNIYFKDSMGNDVTIYFESTGKNPAFDTIGGFIAELIKASGMTFEYENITNEEANTLLLKRLDGFGPNNVGVITIEEPIMLDRRLLGE